MKLNLGTKQLHKNVLFVLLLAGLVYSVFTLSTGTAYATSCNCLYMEGYANTTCQQQGSTVNYFECPIGSYDYFYSKCSDGYEEVDPCFA